MTAIGHYLTPTAMDDAAIGIARGETVDGLTQRLGISKRTLRRWKVRDDFRTRVNQIRREMLATAAGRTSAFAAEAAMSLGKLLKSGNEGIVLGSARALLTLAGGLFKDVELANAIEELKVKVSKLEKAR